VSEYQPPRLLRSAHLQAVLAGLPARQRPLARRTGPLLARTRREIIAGGGDVRLYADVTPAATPGRTAIMLHGWEGSSASMYMLSTAARLVADGYSVVRLNLRDHGDSHHLNRGIFHSCLLDEVVHGVRELSRRAPEDRLYLGGFSLGGNFALRVAMRAPEAGIELRKVVAVCPVLDPRDTMAALEDGLPLYRLYFIRKWRRSLERKRAAFPADYDFGNLARFDSLRAMTEHFVQGYTAFPDLETYLRGYALTGDRLAGLTVPAEILVADDDPVIPVSGLAGLARPPTLTVRRTRHGGHVSFLSDYRLSTWLDDYVSRAFRTP
jgi:predicted alpha/beta-fold hydrolase